MPTPAAHHDTDATASPFFHTSAAEPVIRSAFSLLSERGSITLAELREQLLAPTGVDAETAEGAR